MNANHPRNIAAKAICKHLRGRLKANKIKGSVRKYESCGEIWIGISTRVYEQEFTCDEQRTIQRIARVNHLTGPRGLEIDEDDPISNDAHYVFPVDHPSI